MEKNEENKVKEKFSNKLKKKELLFKGECWQCGKQEHLRLEYLSLEKEIRTSWDEFGGRTEIRLRKFIFKKNENVPKEKMFCFKGYINK